MSENKGSEYFDDFEIITAANRGDLNESTYPGQSESRDMETNNEAEMSAPERPVAKPRTRNQDGDTQHLIHSKRESDWINEKDALLARAENLGEDLKQKKEVIEELQKQNGKHEEAINTLENEKKALQNQNEELDAKNAELASEKEKACEIIKDLQERSQETTAERAERIQELENKVNNLQKSLDEKTESLNEALERINVFENKKIENEENIARLEEKLANVNHQIDGESRKIHQLESTNIKIQEGRAKDEDELTKQKEALTKQKQLYDELSAINDDMENELHEKKIKIRELTSKLQETTKENRQILQEKAEMIRQYQKNENVQEQMEKLNNNAREIQNEKDQLESELVAMKLEQKHLTSDKASHSRELQEMINQTTKLREERDFSAKKCQELEKGIKFNVDNEIKQLSQALEALNEENDVLRKRNEEYKNQIVALRNVKSESETKVWQLGGNFGEENGGFRPGVFDEEPIRQKPFDFESMDTTSLATTDATTDTTTKQWYDSDEGGQLFAQIYGELDSKFSTIEISRAVSTKDVSLVITTDRRQKITVRFPRNFPYAAITVKHNGGSKELMVLNQNAPSELCTQVTKILCELAYE